MRWFTATQMVGALFAMMLVPSVPAHGAVITLSGGDPGDGWVAPAVADLLFAYNLGNPATNRTVQTVTFTGWDNIANTTAPANGAGIAVTLNSNTSSAYAPFTYPGSTPPNDTELAQMMRFIAYRTGTPAGFGPLTLTMTGLFPGAKYRVDAFTYSDGASTRTGETFTYNDGTTDVFNEVNASYLVQDVVTAVGGQIVLSITSASNGTPILSGFAVSAVPEPASVMTLMATAGLILARRRAR